MCASHVEIVGLTRKSLHMSSIITGYPSTSGFLKLDKASFEISFDLVYLFKGIWILFGLVMTEIYLKINVWW